jgi:hypothetical protein
VRVPTRTWVSAGLFGFALLGSVLALRPLWVVGPLWLLLAWAAAPGVLLARRLYDGHRGGALAAALIGPLWGYALSSVVLMVLWTLGARHWGLLLVAPALAWLALWPLRGLRGILTPPALRSADACAVLLLLCLVPAIVGPSYAQVGRDVPEGRAYRAYFTADFVWNMAVVAEVSKGDVPPHNQFLKDRPLNYYWTSHLWPAVEYRTFAPYVRLDRLLLINAIGFGLIFVAFLYLFTRQFTSSPALAAIGCAAAVMLTSFEGLERLVALWRAEMPITELRHLNIDAVARWFYGGLPVDGLHRLLLYQPQHHASAYALGTSALLVLVQGGRRLEPLLMVFVGMLLGMSVLVSAFAAMMLTAMVAAYAAFLHGQRRAWGAMVPHALAGAAPLALAAVAALQLEFVDRSASILELRVNPLALAQPLTTIPLSFGPTLVAIAGAILLAATRRTSDLLPPLVMVLVSALFLVFVNVRDHQDVYVGWRAGHFIFMAAAPLTAVCLAAIWRARALVRWTGTALVGLLALAAAPTIIVDLYNTQDIDNREWGPGFRWTVVLSPDELHALEWIRTETPPHALVQVSPMARHSETWSYIPTFAERRMVAGLPISMVPLEPYYLASININAIYDASSARNVFDWGSRFGINYLVVGPAEREAHPYLEALLASEPHLLPVVLQNTTVTIYQVLPVRPGG